MCKPGLPLILLLDLLPVLTCPLPLQKHSTEGRIPAGCDRDKNKGELKSWRKDAHILGGVQRTHRHCLNSRQGGWSSAQRLTVRSTEGAAEDANKCCFPTRVCAACCNVQEAALPLGGLTAGQLPASVTFCYCYAQESLFSPAFADSSSLFRLPLLRKMTLHR